VTDQEGPAVDQRAWWQRLLGARIDITPLRTSRDFRTLFIAGTVFNLGAMFGYVAVPYQLYALTSSNLAVGAMGVVQLIPLLIFGLYGGALADHVDRRKMLVVTGAAQTALVAVLLGNSLLGQPQVWVLYVVGALMSVASSLQRPSREALIPRVVRHDELPAAVAVSSIGGQLGMLVGPAIGGLLIARYGPPIAFGIEAVGLLVATVMLLRLHRYPPIEESTPPSLRAITEGIGYAVRRKDLLGTYVVDMVGMFMAMPIVLFPALATEVFREPAMLGLLYTAEAIGAVVATLTSGWTASVHHHGRRGLGGCDRRGRPDAERLAGHRLPGRGRWLRHHQRHLPRGDLAPDHPRLDARTAGGDRDAVVLDRTARWPAAVGAGRRPHHGPHVDRQRRRTLRARGGRHRSGPPRLLALRRAHRRPRGAAAQPAGPARRRARTDRRLAVLSLDRRLPRGSAGGWIG
jgi:MFS family permease